ncbi:WD40-repeat-containing domain protein [Fomitopsis serialis]|uniref:WD40-repeat-containing domain protein n=1 Tax=Fomitopsis serialis TaxID=139415 RepID=UPI00200814C8|nr:WD40-repeat-containing domain protein [Neoantrodia serialis]XP_047894574.1 WD40-repeat-containing domain protein [Neoantrodia serialis]KAH9928120.1 WD40-repeat-containing domain protein [Neoantrodia serialis]KAH9928141.1 WD40-repeat-containing domain protein [Neoantrodia serialis]
MSSEFTPRWKATDLHNDAINSIAISPDGKYLSAVLSLAWTGAPDVFVSGTADGTLLTVTVCISSVTISGFEGHRKPIECLAVNQAPVQAGTSPVPYILASAAHESVKVWPWEDTGWGCGEAFQPPRASAYNGDEEPLVTSVQWLHKDKHADNKLVIAYLHHGIHCHHYEKGSSRVLWVIHTPLCGACAVSPTGDNLVISNIVKGFQVYELPSASHRMHVNIEDKPDWLVSLPVKYAVGGAMLFHGDYGGKVRFIDSDQGEHFQTLYHEGWDVIQALAVFDDKTTDRTLVACGSSSPSCVNGICVWEAH